MALVGIWYTNFFDAQTEAILPTINTCTALPPIFSKEIWKAMVNHLTGMASRKLCNRPVSGANQAPTDNTLFTSSFTRAHY